MSRPGDGWIVLEGRHPVREALRAGRKIKEIVIDEGVRPHGVEDIERAASERGIPVRRMARDAFRHLVATEDHQGVLAYARPIDYTPLDSVLEKTAGQVPLLLVCDGVTDPHNLGALLRSADGAGCHGVIIPERRAVGITQAVVKASAGAIEYVPVSRVTNLTRTLNDLKKRGFWVVGTSPAAEKPYWEADLTVPTAIVVGAEGKGVSRLVEETCDVLVSIPMRGKVASLNASVSGALLLYEAARQRLLARPR